MKNITSPQNLKQIINETTAVLIYFSHTDCSVCKVLLPKIQLLLEKYFPKIELCYCNTRKFPEVSAQNRIFTVPSILIYFEQKQYFLLSRNFSIEELTKLIQRPYQLIFE